MSPSKELSFTPYVSLPEEINSLPTTSLKKFGLCGVKQTDRLFVVEMHTGLSRKGPLGSRPGMLLHNGTSSKDHILAAAGYESFNDASIASFSINSVILLPPLESDLKSTALVTEMVRASVRDRAVRFQFSIETGEQLQREQFEWTRFEKTDASGVETDGFNLTRASGVPTQQGGGGGSSSHKNSDGAAVLAVVSWSAGEGFWSFVKVAGFTVRLTGDGLSDALGWRWRLMVIMTAMRIVGLRVNGRASKTFVGMGEKIRG